MDSRWGSGLACRLAWARWRIAKVGYLAAVAERLPLRRGVAPVCWTELHDDAGQANEAPQRFMRLVDRPRGRLAATPRGLSCRRPGGWGSTIDRRART